MTTRATKAAPKKAVPIVDDSVSEETPEQEPEWGSAELNGRRIVFKRPAPEQHMVLRRLSRRLGEAKTPGEQLKVLATVLDAVSALMTSDEDRDFADLEVLEGRATMEDLTPLIMVAVAGNGILEKAADDAKKPRKAVRRARR